MNRVLRLPNAGTLLLCTDLHGNLGDYERIKEIYAAEEAAGSDPFLLFSGDLVHGPSPDLHEPGAWPEYLGTRYVGRSAELVRDYQRFVTTARTACLLGNHEHAHVGGPVVPKFYPDEAAVLDAALGEEAPAYHGFLRSCPLLAVAACGLVVTHGAPGASAPLAALETLDYAGYEHVPLHEMYRLDVQGALLWCRSATGPQARALLHELGHDSGLVAYGHDVVHAGYEIIGASQICVSSSYGLYDIDKRYLRLDLGARYRSTADLRVGVEIRSLYP